MCCQVGWSGGDVGDCWVGESDSKWTCDDCFVILQFRTTQLGTRSVTYFTLRSRASLNVVITGLALSVEEDELKMLIPCVCDARLLERNETEKTLSFDVVFTRQSQGYVSYPMRAFVRIHYGVLGAKLMVMLQQCVGGIFLDERSVQEDMRVCVVYV